MAIEYHNKWVRSYETVLFDTADGDLHFYQFARYEDGYIIRTKSKSESNFECVGMNHNVNDLQEVQIIGKAYYNEFLDAKRKIARVRTNQLEYDGIRYIKNHPQPVRIELVDQLPEPDPPKQPPEHHSIAFDGASDTGYLPGPISSWSWGHECDGDNRLLAVGVCLRTNASRTISSATYNGDSLSQITSDFYSTVQTFLLYMVAPDSGGSYNVSITLDDTVYATVSGAISYTGAAQTGQPDTYNQGHAYSQSASVSVTTGEDGCWVISAVCAQGSSLTPSQTQRWNQAIYQTVGGGSDIEVSSAGNQTMTWTLNDGTGWSMVAASFIPADEGTTLELSGSISGQSAASGDASSKKELSGSADGDSSASGNVKVKKSLSGTVSAQGSLTATLLSGKGISGGTEDIGALSGALGSQKTLAVTCGGQSVVSGTVKIKKQLSGIIVGQAVISGDTKTAVRLSGLATCQSDLGGDISSAQLLSGSSDAESDISGDLSMHVPLNLSGSISGQSTVSGQVMSAKKLAGGIAVQSDVSGNIHSEKVLTGSCDAVSVATAVLKVKKTLSGSIDSQSTAGGDLTLFSNYGLSGSTSSQSTASGNLKAIKSLSGSVNVQAGISADLGAKHSLSGQCSTQSNITSDIKIIKFVSGQVDAQSKTTGAMKVRKDLSSQISALSGSAGFIAMQAVLAGICEAQSTATGNLRIVGIGAVRSRLNSLAGDNPHLGGLVA